MAAAPANKISTLAEHPKTRKDQAQGYFFIMPDWLAARLCQERATGAMWAVTTYVGQMTRWSHTPGIISLSQYAADIHYAKQSISDAIARLVGIGLLYEEIEANGQQRRYALIDLTIPTCQTADGKPAVALLGDVIYPLPDEGVLKSRTAKQSYYKRKQCPKIEEGTVLKSRRRSPKIEEGTVLKSRRLETHQPTPGQAAASVLDYEDNKEITKDSTPDGVAATAAPSADQGAEKSAQKQDTTAPKQTKSKRDPQGNDKRNIPPPAKSEETIQPALLPYMVVSSLPADSHVPAGEQRGCLAAEQPKKQKNPALRDNPLYPIWCEQAPTPSTRSEFARWTDGLGQLLAATPPVTVTELPRLLAVYQVWMKKKRLALNPQAIASNLVSLREEAKCYLWCDPPEQDSQSDEPGEASSAESLPEESPEEAVSEDFSWTTRLRLSVPDPEGARHGRSERDVGMLWGFVRDELRPGLNTARRQHLDALTAAWDPEHRDELLLLSSAYYTVHFVESTMLSEINERVDKQLSRFFDRAMVLAVPQWVIDALRGPVQPEEELAAIPR